LPTVEVFYWIVTIWDDEGDKIMKIKEVGQGLVEYELILVILALLIALLRALFGG